MRLLGRALLMAGCAVISVSVSAQKKKDYAASVDPFIGTAITNNHSPGAVLPYAMIQVGPVTKIGVWDWITRYNYKDSLIYGFANTHLSGNIRPDQCDIVFMPTTGQPHFQAGEYGSTFKKKNEVASPGYYKTKLDKYGVEVELTATNRAGMQLYNFPSGQQADIIIDLGQRNEAKASFEVVNNNEIKGKITVFQRTLYFYTKFSKPFNAYQASVGGMLTERLAKADGENIKIAVSFTNPGQVIVKTGISAVSYDGALKNLDTEIPAFDFRQVVKNAKASWNLELGKIDAEGGAPAYQPAAGTGSTSDMLIDATGKKKSPLPDYSKIKTTAFYTALYHSMLAPNINSDVDGKFLNINLWPGPIRPIYNADGFVCYSFLHKSNTYPTQYPLLPLLDKKRTTDIIKSFLTWYDHKDENSTSDMMLINLQVAPIIVDAYSKGIRDFNAENSLAAMKYYNDMLGVISLRPHAASKPNEPDVIGRPDPQYPYHPLNTMTIAYTDWCIAQMAKMLNKPVDYNIYIVRAQFWKNTHSVSDASMQERINGGFRPLKKSTNDNNWLYAFAVPHDINTLIERDGGESKFATKLDELFTSNNKTTDSNLIGNYNHSVSVTHLAPYLYNFTSEANKTQFYLTKIIRNLYSNKPDGLPGFDYNGSLSSWYVMICLGFYNIAPGQQQYLLGIPQFTKTVVTLESGKKFTIFNSGIAINWDNIYLQGINFNKKAYSKLYLNYADMANGGEFEVFTGTLPNRLTMQDMEKPTSRITDNLITPNPVIKQLPTFAPPTLIEIKSNDNEPNMLYYTTDGSTPTTASKLYDKPIPQTPKMVLKAIAVKKGKPSFVTEARFE